MSASAAGRGILQRRRRQTQPTVKAQFQYNPGQAFDRLRGERELGQRGKLVSEVLKTHSSKSRSGRGCKQMIATLDISLDIARAQCEDGNWLRQDGPSPGENPTRVENWVC